MNKFYRFLLTCTVVVFLSSCAISSGSCADETEAADPTPGVETAAAESEAPAAGKDRSPAESKEAPEPDDRSKSPEESIPVPAGAEDIPDEQPEEAIPEIVSDTRDIPAKEAPDIPAKETQPEATAEPPAAPAEAEKDTKTVPAPVKDVAGTETPTEVMPSTEPAAEVMSSTEPAAEVMSSTEPAAVVMPSTEPAAVVMSSTEPAAEIMPSTEEPSAGTEEPARTAEKPEAVLRSQEVELHSQEAETTGTYSVKVKNQVYGYAGSADDDALDAQVTLRIENLTSLPETLAGWIADGTDYILNLVLKNMQEKTVPGIPNSIPVWMETLFGSAIGSGSSAQKVTKSAIINGSHQSLDTPDIELNSGGTSQDSYDISLIRTVDRDEAVKPVYVVNDSDADLTLSIDAEGTAYTFAPNGEGLNTSTVAPGTSKKVTIPAKGWGYLSSDPLSGDPAAAGVQLTSPDSVEKISASLGDADVEQGTWKLTPGTAPGNGSYVVYRLAPKADPTPPEKTDPEEPEKADPEDPEKTDPEESEKADPEDPEKTDPEESEKADPEKPSEAPDAQEVKTPSGEKKDDEKTVKEPDEERPEGTPDADDEEEPGEDSEDSENEEEPGEDSEDDGGSTLKDLGDAPAKVIKKSEKTPARTVRKGTPKPQTPSTQMQAASPQTDPVKTGDPAPIRLLLAVMLIAAGAVLALLKKLRHA